MKMTEALRLNGFDELNCNEMYEIDGGKFSDMCHGIFVAGCAAIGSLGGPVGGVAGGVIGEVIWEIVFA
jgi:hypothetical protein